MKEKMSPREKKRLGLVIAIASVLLVAQNFFWFYTTGRPYIELLGNNPKKIYRAIPLPPAPSTTGTADIKTTSRANEDIETTSETVSETPVKTESLEESPNPEGIDNGLVSNENNGTPPKQEKSQQEHSHEDHLAESETSKALKAEVRADMQAATELLESSMAHLKDTMPLFVNELSTKSVEEQRTFLNQLKDGLSDSLPAEIQEFMSNNPEMLEKTWTTFLDMLTEAGYAVPEEVK